MFKDSDISPKVVTSTLFVFLVLILIIFVLSLELWESKKQLELNNTPVEYIEIDSQYNDEAEQDTTTQQNIDIIEEQTSIKVQRPETPDATQGIDTTDKWYDGKLDGKYWLFQSFFTDESWGNNMTRWSFTNTWWEENIEVLENTNVKVTYPKGSYKPSESPRWGAGFIYWMNQNFEELKLSYNITLAENFNFVKWGKLPGICWGDCSRWSEDASDGFSVHFVWKKDGYLDSVISSHSSLSLYGDQTGKQYFKMSPWGSYNLNQYIKLNTPWKKDGVIVISIDGQEVFRSENEDLRNKSDILMDSVLFSSFFSGWDSSWATPVDTSIIFSNFKIDGK